MESSEFMNSVVNREYRYLIDNARADGNERRAKDLEKGLEEAWRKHREALKTKKSKG